MAGNGLSGFVDGIIKGIQPGLVIGDAIAQRRSSGRMQELQAAIDRGDYKEGGKYADSAEAQAALQAATQYATAPLSRRGLDNGDYGATQYARLLAQQTLRGDQKAGAQANAGHLADGLMTSSRTAGAMGNLPGMIQASQAAGQVRAGTSAVGADGVVDQEALARGVSANDAMHGDASGAAAWGDRQKTQADASVQGMLGKALTIASSPALGGLEGAVPYIHSAAQLAGYGDARWSPSTKTIAIIDQSGNSIANINEQTLPSFLQTIGNDPEKILPAIRASQVQQAGDQRDAAKYTSQKTTDAALDVAKQWVNPPAGSQAAQLQDKASILAQKAELAGWKIDTGTGTDVQDAKGNPVGKKWFAQPPGGGAPVVISMLNPDPNNPVSATFSVTNQQGQPVDMTGAEGTAFAASVQAQVAQAQAYAASLAYNHARVQQQLATVNDVAGQLPGSVPRGPSGGAAEIPQALQAYQSPHSDLDAPQMQAESGGDQGAVSPRGARGSMQLMPETQTELEREFGLPHGAASADTPQGKEINTQLGRVYRDRLIDGYTQKAGDPTQGRLLGLMAYNWGMGNVNDWLAAGANPAKVPKETKLYVAKILAPNGRTPAAPRNSGIMGQLSAGEKSRSRADMSGQAPARAVPRELLPNGASSKYLFKG